MASDFSKNLRILRKELNLSQEEVAEKISLTRRQVSFLETGTYEPDLKTLIAIAKFFAVSTDYLLGLED